LVVTGVTIVGLFVAGAFENTRIQIAANRNGKLLTDGIANEHPELEARWRLVGPSRIQLELHGVKDQQHELRIRNWLQEFRAKHNVDWRVDVMFVAIGP
jgi:hypothetical protein